MSRDRRRTWLALAVLPLLGGVVLGALLLGGVIGGPPASLADLPARQRADFRAHQRQAQEQMRLGRWEGAEADLHRCLAIFEPEPSIHTALAKVYMGRRLRSRAGPRLLPETEEDDLVARALVALDRALDLEPSSVPALMARFQIRHDPRMRAHDPDAALEDAETVLRLAPENSAFRWMLVDWLLGPVRFARVVGQPTPYDSRLGLAVAERHVRALEERAAPGSDEHVRARATLARVVALQGKEESAAGILSGLLREDPDPEARANLLIDLGAVHLQAWSFEPAVEGLREAMRALPEGAARLEPAWLLRLATMASGDDVETVPPDLRFPFPAGDPDPADTPRLAFTDISERLAVGAGGGEAASALADLDDDGDPDLVAAGEGRPLFLLRNDGDSFRETGSLLPRAWGPTVQLVDPDGDGDLDLHIVRGGVHGPQPNLLLRNDGSLSSLDATDASGLADGGSGSAALWADFDRDGDLDVFVANGAAGDGSTSRLFRNDGRGVFEDVTVAAGLAEPRTWGAVGAAAGDPDGDGDLDIFVNGRGDAPNRLYRNRGDGFFDEEAAAAGVAGSPHRGTACLFLDYDGDARPDILAASQAPWRDVLEALASGDPPPGPSDLHPDAPRLYRNLGDGTFADVTLAAGLHRPAGVTGAAAGDLDNDGHVDLLLSTGGDEPHRLEWPVLYHNQGDGSFRDRTALAGLDDAGRGNGLGLADLDLDGDLDVLVSRGGGFPGLHEPDRLYRNDAGSESHWLHVRLVGGGANRFAVGAQVILFAGETRQHRQVVGGAGSGTTGSYPVEFGLGDLERIDRLEVIWPGGGRQILESPPVDRRIRVTEGTGDWQEIPRRE